MTEEKASEKLGRMTLRHMAMLSGSIVMKGTRRGVNLLNGGLENMNRVRKVTTKWKHAKLSWHSLSWGSEKMALFVKT